MSNEQEILTLKRRVARLEAAVQALLKHPGVSVPPIASFGDPFNPGGGDNPGEPPPPPPPPPPGP